MANYTVITCQTSKNNYTLLPADTAQRNRAVFALHAHEVRTLLRHGVVPFVVVCLLVVEQLTARVIYPHLCCFGQSAHYKGLLVRAEAQLAIVDIRRTRGDLFRFQHHRQEEPSAAFRPRGSEGIVLAQQVGIETALRVVQPYFIHAAQVATCVQ